MDPYDPQLACLCVREKEKKRCVGDLQDFHELGESLLCCVGDSLLCYAHARLVVCLVMSAVLHCMCGMYVA